MYSKSVYLVSERVRVCLIKCVLCVMFLCHISVLQSWSHIPNISYQYVSKQQKYVQNYDITKICIILIFPKMSQILKNNKQKIKIKMNKNKIKSWNKINVFFWKSDLKKNKYENRIFGGSWNMKISKTWKMRHVGGTDKQNISPASLYTRYSKFSTKSSIMLNGKSWIRRWLQYSWVSTNSRQTHSWVPHAEVCTRFFLCGQKMYLFKCPHLSINRATEQKIHTKAYDYQQF